MKRPEEVTLRREDGVALIERLEKDALTAEDWRALVKVLTLYFCLLFALREAKLSLQRLRTLVFSEKPKNASRRRQAGLRPVGGAATESGRPQHQKCA